jgi:hypothetical protein
MVSFIPLVTLFLKKGQRYSINRRVGGNHSESGFSGALAPATVMPQQSWICKCTSKYAIYWTLEKSRKCGSNYLTTNHNSVVSTVTRLWAQIPE